MERLNLCSELDLQRLNAEPNLPLDPITRRARKIAAYNEHQEIDDQIKLLFRKKERLGFDPYTWTPVREIRSRSALHRPWSSGFNVTVCSKIGL